jgi:phosphoglycerate dehydrogenase-like enzyme
MREEQPGRGAVARPPAVLAMVPGVDQQLLTADSRAELEQLVDLLSDAAVDLAALPDEQLGEVEIVVGSWGCNVLDDALLARMPKLRLLAYAAGTVKHTVTPATWERGVVVTSAAAANAVPVAEFTFAAIVMIAKDVFRTRDALRETRGRTPVSGTGPNGALGTRGLHIGLVGASNIGRLVVERLATLDVSVAVADPYLAADDADRLGVTRMELDELFAWSDIVSVHAPELPSTHHLVDANRLARLHDGAWLINTARGSLVDTDALTRECVAGRLNALVDTPEPEPLPPASPLYDLPNVVLTPHIAGSLGSELSRMGDLAVAELRRFLAGDPLQHEVRADDLDRIA